MKPVITRFRRGLPSLCWVLVATYGLLLPLAHAGPLISNVNTDKARHLPGAAVTIYVDFQNSTGTNFSGSVQLALSHLGPTITNFPAQAVSLVPEATATRMFTWLPPAVDFKGYLVRVEARTTSGSLADTGSTAVDVSSDWAKFPRYGFVSHFGTGVDTHNAVWQLKNYHINGLQFYDWQWKHHVPYSPAATWPDILNRTISRQAVVSFINAAHGYGMVAMNYNLYGGAYSNYLSDGSGVTMSMGIFSGPRPAAGYTLNDQLGHTLGTWAATPKIFTMSNRDLNWQSHIFGRELDVFNNFAFDGWHIDSLGQNSVWDFDGNNFNLQDHFPQFINNAKSALNKRMLFNSVDGGGESQVAQNGAVDFLYSELWGANANYLDFKTRVDSVRRHTSKAVVFPAYMNYRKTSDFFNEASVRLADAAIFACGASHLELGDGGEMLRTEYFPENTVKMSPSLKEVLRTYYDFLVGYQNLLRDGTVSASHYATIAGVPVSSTAEAGAVWAISKKNLGHQVLHLINLLNNPSTLWRDDYGTYPVPTTRSNLTVKMYYSGTISGGKLRWASPDLNNGAAAELSFTAGSDPVGTYISFTLPQLQYWDMVWLELKGATSAASQIEAESYDSMSAIGTESAADTGGGDNVGFVNNVNGDSYVVFGNVDFADGPATVSARVASPLPQSALEFRLNHPSGPLIATLNVGNTGGWQNWQTVTAPVSAAEGVHHLFVIFKNAAANLNWFKFNFPLPNPWSAADIGAVGSNGSASYAANTFTVTGSGADIESAADAFHYVWQPVGGTCELRARVLSVQDTDPWAKAGVMFRDGPAADAMNVALVVTPERGLNFQRRTATGSGTTSTTLPTVTAPCWVRLVRSEANAFSGYYSSDGLNWIQIGTTITVPMSNTARAGLAVTAHNNTASCTATFNSVSVNQPPALAPVPNITDNAGSALSITNSGMDPDLPPQALTYALVSPPAGAAIDTNTGLFLWRPAIAQSPSTQTVTVVVSDSGLPNMSATQSFLLTITRPAAPALTITSSASNGLGFVINGDVGPDYNVQASTNLVHWSSIIRATPSILPWNWSDTNAGAFPFRFYKVLLGP